MRLLKILPFILFPICISAQTPEKQKLKEYFISDKGDTIRFYIHTADNLKKEKVFLYIQGSGDLPLVNGDNAEPCCYNNYPRKLMADFPKDYAFVYIQKVGLPYYTKTLDGYTPSQTFIHRNNVLDRAEVANKVINYIKRRIYPDAKIIAVLGHSEGSDVVVKLATRNKHITHICFSAGNANAQIFNDILFTRRDMLSGNISAAQAQAKIDELMNGFNQIYLKPNSTQDYFNGDTYKWNTAINEPPINNLLKLNIPIFLTIGSNDDKVPVEASDLVVVEFIRNRKNNLTSKVYLNCNHNFEEIKEDGTKISRWNEMFFDFLNFVEKDPK
ncbi:MAG: acyl-CoA thioester hydrolase/BAAT C-terminal domain-containing protein [Breznakibacter sp.]